MLDNGTKRRIDNARDILVGKVPDPKAQVEQITTALIYKFMDDMDQEAIALGGKASFFVGEYAKYAWPKVMAKSLSGFDRLALYSEAITRMSQNRHLPQLFRDIFKGAFLPYRDPETLNLFLKEIDGFKYDNSERLGDAFEHLLSIMGSQGAAGQFRTPRHIIDFIVEVVAPTKTDTVLDPACGTAGFLISAYKHILYKNKEKKLSPDEMLRLTKNFVGYDISPEMVRLSLVNMYLHQFQKPTVFEYDTLTSEERWDDSFDVVLANPPFMSPKGGIRPHTRFAVQAKRSEVLFVDYIAEHLNPGGRAGVIVPEGIIFQSAKAYKALRKMLIEENYLYAVVSLPAGVFKPYSGVKTSILLMDQSLAKRTDKIIFVKIKNDGFDLGAQRREIKLNDLPKALQAIKDFQKISEIDKVFYSPLAYVVGKNKIIEDSDYSLSASRYQELDIYKKVKWPLVLIKELCDLGRGRVISKKYIEEHAGDFPVFSSQTVNDGIFGYINSFDFEGDYVTWTTDGANAGTVFHRTGKFNCTNVCGTLKAKKINISMKYLARILNHIAYKYVIQVGNPKLMNREMGRIKIPLPPLEVQQAIVDEVEGYQKIIDGARQVVENYRPRIKVDPEWEMKEIKSLCEISRGASPRPIKEYITTEDDGIPWIKIGDTKDTIKYITKTKEKITKKGAEKSRFVKPGDFILSNSMSFGRPYISNIIGCIHDGWLLLKIIDKRINMDFMYYILSSDLLARQFEKHATGGVVRNLNSKLVGNIKIPLPATVIQEQIVKMLEEEQSLVNSSKQLIKIFEKKIEEKIGEVWGEE